MLQEGPIRNRRSGTKGGTRSLPLKRSIMTSGPVSRKEMAVTPSAPSNLSAGRNTRRTHRQRAIIRHTESYGTYPSPRPRGFRMEQERSEAP